SSFAQAYGGDYGNRLRLVALPACALTTPNLPKSQKQTDLGSVNAGGVVSADIGVSGDNRMAASPAAAPAPTVLALAPNSSWAGEGWDLQVGFVERSYRSCNLDGGSTADLCWFSSYNGTLVFQGRSTMLVRDNTSGVWHASDDSGLKIEQVFDTSKANGDNDG